MTCYQNTWNTCFKYKVLFFICSDNISCRHVIRIHENKTFRIRNDVFFVFWWHVCMTCYQNTWKHVGCWKYCFPYVLITCMHDMLSEHEKTTHYKPNVSETNIIRMCCTEMLLEQIENNTFQSQQFRNQWNNNYANLPILK